MLHVNLSQQNPHAYFQEQGGTLWKLSKPGHPDSFLFGNIFSIHPRITNIDSSLNVMLKKVLFQVDVVFTQLHFPLTYKPKSTFVLDPQSTDLPCNAGNFKTPELYTRLIDVLEQNGFKVCNKFPMRCVGNEINPTFVLSKEMFAHSIQSIYHIK